MLLLTIERRGLSREAETKRHFLDYQSSYKSSQFQGLSILRYVRTIQDKLRASSSKFYNYGNNEAIPPLVMATDTFSFPGGVPK